MASRLNAKGELTKRQIRRLAILNRQLARAAEKQWQGDIEIIIREVDEIVSIWGEEVRSASAPLSKADADLGTEADRLRRVAELRKPR